MAYPLLTIVTVFMIVGAKLSFGPMKKEEIKNNIQEVFEHQPTADTVGKVANLFGPMLLLFTLILGTILYTGNCFLFGGPHSILDAFKQNSSIFFILFFASINTFCFTAVYFWQQNLVSCMDIYYAIKNSFTLMHSVLVMIFLVAIFSSLLRNELGTGIYLAQITTGHLSLVYIPLIFFITATIIAFSTGTSWGTFGLLLPIGIPMVVKMANITTPTDALAIPLLYQTIGAIFSGALCGDHLSLFSETTAMSAASAQVSPLLHFKTQLPYGIPVMCGSALFFGLSGYLYVLPLWQNYLCSIIAGLLLTIGMVVMANRYTKKLFF
jgi:Na+/H+ antiporter NhaC